MGVGLKFAIESAVDDIGTGFAGFGVILPGRGDSAVVGASVDSGEIDIMRAGGVIVLKVVPLKSCGPLAA